MWISSVIPITHINLPFNAAYTATLPSILILYASLSALACEETKDTVDTTGDLQHANSGTGCKGADTGVVKSSEITEGVRIQDIEDACEKDSILANALKNLKGKESVMVAGKSKGKVTIGHGVWIGDSVIILGAVSVGNGAVIGAGSVVTKSILPYSIAVGNPARTIKYRFNQEIIDLIEKSKWWEWDIKKIKQNKFIFDENLENITVDEFKLLLNKIKWLLINVINKKI